MRSSAAVSSKYSQTDLKIRSLQRCAVQTERLTSHTLQLLPYLTVFCGVWSPRLKGKPQNQIYIFIPLTCSAFYQSKLFWCELPGFGDIGRSSNIMRLNGAQCLKNSLMSLSGNYDPVILNSLPVVESN